jgi:hypothetical protein
MSCPAGRRRSCCRTRAGLVLAARVRLAQRGAAPELSGHPASWPDGGHGMPRLMSTLQPRLGGAFSWAADLPERSRAKARECEELAQATRDPHIKQTDVGHHGEMADHGCLRRKVRAVGRNDSLPFGLEATAGRHARRYLPLLSPAKRGSFLVVGGRPEFPLGTFRSKSIVIETLRRRERSWRGPLGRAATPRPPSTPHLGVHKRQGSSIGRARV